MQRFFEDLVCFKKLKKEYSLDDDGIYYCCKELRYRKYSNGSNICVFGEEGYEFYVIIHGTVGVLVPV